MPLQERVQLARALADKHGKKFTRVADWRPLLKFTQGNPLTITVLVGQALRSGLQTKQEIEDFVTKLRKGEAEITDEASQKRSRSLRASLSHGFASAFGEGEQKVLALLHLFQGFVDARVLKIMGDPNHDWSLSELHAYDPDMLMALLDRGAEIGMLTAHRNAYYSIHPALPWFFKDAFERSYGDGPLDSARAFVEAMGELGSYYHAQYEDGNRDVIGALMTEEANLLHARLLALNHDWWDAVVNTTQGLHQLYDHTGRRAEWRRLVNQIVPEFVDSATDGPLPGREAQWSVVTQYRVFLAEEDRDWHAAQTLQQVATDWDRKRAGELVNQAPQTLTDPERNTVRTLAASIHELAELQRKQDLADCVGNYQEGFRLAERIGDHPVAAACAFNLGHAYRGLSSIRDLEEAEHWYQKGLELTDAQDFLQRAKGLGELGSVAFRRFMEVRDAKVKEDVLLSHLNDALRYYHQALDLLPHNAIDELAVTHDALGSIYSNAGNIDKALEHYRESIRCEEKQGNIYGAGQTRYNVARATFRAGRLADALEYARAALDNFQQFGDRAVDMVQLAQQLIAHIEQTMKERDKSK